MSSILPAALFASEIREVYADPQPFSEEDTCHAGYVEQLQELNAWFVMTDAELVRYRSAMFPGVDNQEDLYEIQRQLCLQWLPEKITELRSSLEGSEVLRPIQMRLRSESLTRLENILTKLEAGQELFKLDELELCELSIPLKKMEHGGLRNLSELQALAFDVVISRYSYINFNNYPILKFLMQAAASNAAWAFNPEPSPTPFEHCAPSGRINCGGVNFVAYILLEATRVIQDARYYAMSFELDPEVIRQGLDLELRQIAEDTRIPSVLKRIKPDGGILILYPKNIWNTYMQAEFNASLHHVQGLCGC